MFSDVGSGVASVRSDTGRERDPDGRTRGFYAADDVEALRAAGPITFAAWGEDGEPLPSVPSPVGDVRRAEIIAAHDRWRAERRAVEDAVGFTAAWEVEAATGEAYYEADEAVQAHQPRTVAGLLAKGAWVEARLSEPGFTGDLGQAFARQVAAFGGGIVSPATFDPAALVAALQAAECRVVLSTPGTCFGPGDERATYFIVPADGEGFGDACSDVMVRWANAMADHPDPVGAVVAHLSAAWEAGA